MDISKLIRVDWGQRAVLVGKTGTGKTTLARVLLKNFQHVVIYDTKGLIEWPEYELHTTIKTLMNSESERLIYKPNLYELYDKSIIDTFFKWIYLRKNTALYVDEAGMVSQKAFIPVHYFGCLTRGRERGITLLSSTQRPISIGQPILSESERFFIFGLKLPQDRQKIEEVTGIKKQAISEKQLRNHHFYYADSRTVKGPFKLSF